jgi:hypothetical protein
MIRPTPFYAVTQEQAHRWLGVPCVFPKGQILCEIKTLVNMNLTALSVMVRLKLWLMNCFTWMKTSLGHLSCINVPILSEGKKSDV